MFHHNKSCIYAHVYGYADDRFARYQNDPYFLYNYIIIYVSTLNISDHTKYECVDSIGSLTRQSNIFLLYKLRDGSDFTIADHRVSDITLIVVVNPSIIVKYDNNIIGLTII